MKRVFVDSGGFFAHLVAEDAWHERATALFQAARADSWRLMTTNVVLNHRSAPCAQVPARFLRERP